jgi:hypothetical protein
MRTRRNMHHSPARVQTGNVASAVLISKVRVQLKATKVGKFARWSRKRRCLRFPVDIMQHIDILTHSVHICTNWTYDTVYGECMGECMGSVWGVYGMEE